MPPFDFRLPVIHIEFLGLIDDVNICLKSLSLDSFVGCFEKVHVCVVH